MYHYLLKLVVQRQYWLYSTHSQCQNRFSSILCKHFFLMFKPILLLQKPKLEAIAQVGSLYALQQLPVLSKYVVFPELLVFTYLFKGTQYKLADPVTPFQPVISSFLELLEELAFQHARLQYILEIDVYNIINTQLSCYFQEKENKKMTQLSYFLEKTSLQEFHNKFFFLN